MSDRRILYSAQNVIDFFEGTFNIPCDGPKSDIEGFEDDGSDCSDVDEPVFSGFCPRVPVHRSRHKERNNTLQ